MSCAHLVTKGREGETGSWCCDCGVKVYAVHDRPCGECAFFKPDAGCNGRVGVCYMRVTASMHVNYRIEHGHTPGQERGLCFLPSSHTTSTEDAEKPDK